MQLSIGRLLGVFGVIVGAGTAVTLGGCASDMGSEGEALGESADELLLSSGGSYDGKNGPPTPCTVNGVTMHCCPSGMVMTGANLDRNIFKCTPPSSTFNTLGAPFIDGPDGWPNQVATQRQGMHACPIQAVMVGFHLGRNDLLCAYVNTDHGLQESVDTGTQEASMPGHVCPPANGSPAFAGTWFRGKAMSGIRADSNRFLCAD